MTLILNPNSIINPIYEKLNKIKKNFEINFKDNCSFYIKNVEHQKKVKDSELKFNYYNDLDISNALQYLSLNYDMNEFDVLNYERLYNYSVSYIFYSFNKDTKNPICIILFDSNIILDQYNNLIENQQYQRLTPLEDKDKILAKLEGYDKQLKLTEEQIKLIEKQLITLNQTPPSYNTSYYHSFQKYLKEMTREYESKIKTKKELESKKEKITKYIRYLVKKSDEIDKKEEIKRREKIEREEIERERKEEREIEEIEREREEKTNGEKMLEWLANHKRLPM